MRREPQRDSPMRREPHRDSPPILHHLPSLTLYPPPSPLPSHIVRPCHKEGEPSPRWRQLPVGVEVLEEEVLEEEEEEEE